MLRKEDMKSLERRIIFIFSKKPNDPEDEEYGCYGDDTDDDEDEEWE